MTVRLLATLALVAAITALYFRGVRANATTVTLTYLIAVLVIAAFWGLLEATVASVAAVLCSNYFFLPPVGAFTIADPQNWVALFAFLVTTITASQLSAHVKRRTSEAIHRRQEMEELYALSCAILLTDPKQPVAKQIAYQIARIFELPAVALYDGDRGEIYQAGREDLPGIENKLREAALQGTLFHDDSTPVVVTSIRLGAEPTGSLALSGAVLSDTALQSLSNLVAIGLEKVRAQEAANRAEAARQSDELKSTLLEAITHEFKTPLTSLKAATTALLSDMDNKLGEYREVITIADEEVDRLTRFLVEAIQAARIEGGHLRLNKALHSPVALVFRAVQQMRLQIAGREVRLVAPDKLPLVFVDSELLELALRQVIENGLKYSPPAAELTIAARPSQDGVIISIADQGPGIPASEQGRVFEKFYRGVKDRRQVTGTGMGLAIAREILRAHGGDISLKSAPGQGSEFCLSIPAASQEKTA